jgi:hypothetical protein
MICLARVKKSTSKVGMPLKHDSRTGKYKNLKHMVTDTGNKMKL